MNNLNLFLLLTMVIAVSSQDETDLISTILNNTSIEEACQWVRSQQLEDACFQQLKVVCENDTFRAIMLDSSSKFPYTGMLVKSRLDFGSYDECIDLDLTSNNTRVVGKHCLASLIIPTTSILDPNVVDKAYKLSACLPDQCSAKYLLKLANLSYIYPLFNDNSCSVKYHKPFDWSDYMAILFFSLISAIIVMSTGYDLYHHHFNKDIPNKILQTFSIFYNGKKLFKVSKPTREHIQVIHGLRVISTMWIVLGHSFITQLTSPVTNEQTVIDLMLSWNSFYITTAYMAVDTFFFISGLLLAYQFFKTECPTLKNYLVKVPQIILHRYIRLTPMVVATFILIITIARYAGNGPMYQSFIEIERDRCLKYWWSYLLYVQNYVNYSDVCLAHTWYISADWQLFLVALLVVIPMTLIANRSSKWIMSMMLAINVVFILVPTLTKHFYGYFDNEYETHTRLHSYFIGFMLGVYLRKNNNTKLRFSDQSILMIWSCVIGAMLAVALLYKKAQMMILENDDRSYTLYFIPLRGIWAVCLTWVVYACQYGYGGYINSFLTTPLVKILSKLTFGIYMTHTLLTYYNSGVSRVILEAGHRSGIQTTVMIYTSSVMVSIIWTLAFESPIIALEAYLFRRR